MFLLFSAQILILIFFCYFCFHHKLWKQNFVYKILLFLAPFSFGCFLLWFDFHYLSLATLQRWYNLFCCFCIIVILSLLPQWYKLMWLLLVELPIRHISDNTKLLFTILFSTLMVLAIIFFFTLYFLWLDRLSGYTQGLRSTFPNYQPIILDFPTAFYFSFSCYFSLGFSSFHPYGYWFYLLIFLECLIALLNNGIIVFYAFHFLFERK